MVEKPFTRGRTLDPQPHRLLGATAGVAGVVVLVLTAATPKVARNEAAVADPAPAAVAVRAAQCPRPAQPSGVSCDGASMVTDAVARSPDGRRTATAAFAVLRLKPTPARRDKGEASSRARWSGIAV